MSKAVYPLFRFRVPAGILLLAVLPMVLGGCTRPVWVREAAAPDLRQRLWSARVERLRSRGSWRMEGRVAVKRGADGWQVSLVWSQEAGSTRVVLFDPVGRRVARLEVAEGEAVLVARGRTYRARSPESLMHRVLGWSLPVSGLRWWLLGIPAPGGSMQGLELDENGRAAGFIQSGWDMTFKQYERWDGEWMPVRAEFSQAPVRVRLLVTRWVLP